MEPQRKRWKALHRQAQPHLHTPNKSGQKFRSHSKKDLSRPTLFLRSNSNKQLLTPQNYLQNMQHKEQFKGSTVSSLQSQVQTPRREGLDRQGICRLKQQLREIAAEADEKEKQAIKTVTKVAQKYQFKSMKYRQLTQSQQPSMTSLKNLLDTTDAIKQTPRLPPRPTNQRKTEGGNTSKTGTSFSSSQVSTSSKTGGRGSNYYFNHPK